MPLLKKATILFDLSHKEMLNIGEREFSEFYKLLQRLGVKIKINESKDLNRKILDNVDILIIGNPIDTFFSTIEIKDIGGFVRDGGGLLLGSEYGADFLQKTNLNDIGKIFGIFFEKNLLKEDNDINHNCHSILSVQNFQSHKITNQVRDLIIGGSCSLLLRRNSKTLINSNETAWSEIYNNSTNTWLKNESGKSQILSGFTEHGRGKVVAIGDVDIFTNDPNIGLKQLDNRKFILNILNWLIEPAKESDVIAWTLNQVGSIQNEVKQMNLKINNIIETMTLLEKRISKIEDDKGSEYKKNLEKKDISEENSTLI
jgi:hypothetical protein